MQRFGLGSCLPLCSTFAAVQPFLDNRAPDEFTTHASPSEVRRSPLMLPFNSLPIVFGCVVTFGPVDDQGPRGPDSPFGQFIGNVDTRWTTDRDMELLSDFAYVDPSGRRWDAPKGSRIDGASIPQALWTIVGSPFTGAY